MTGFRTSSSIYYVDIRNKLIWGGKLGNNPRQYIEGRFVIGTRGYAKFVDGGEIITGVILSYV